MIIFSDVLIQKSDGYILEAQPAESRKYKMECSARMENIFKGLAEAKQKEENFKKRQVGWFWKFYWDGVMAMEDMSDEISSKGVSY